MKSSPSVARVLVLSAFLITAAWLGAEDGLAPYKAVSGINGNLSSVGSDTLNNLMTLWAESFNRFYPGVRVQIEGKGSSTAPPALISGTAQIGPMSRAMKSTEIDQFESKFGYPPTQVRVAVDALGVFVHKDNPIAALTLEQVDAIFSKARRRGGKSITTWGQLGLTGEWANAPISLYGRNSASGTYGFFKEHVLKNGDYKDEVKEQPGSASVVLGVTEDRYAIGYSGIGYATAGVKGVSIADSGEAFAPTKENAYANKYPITRYLFVYVNRPADGAPAPLVHEFLKMVLSREGQDVVVKDGYFPLPASVVAEETQKLNSP